MSLEEAAGTVTENLVFRRGSQCDENNWRQRSSPFCASCWLLGQCGRASALAFTTIAPSRALSLSGSRVEQLSMV